MNQHSKLEEERESLNTLRRLNHNQVIEREIEVNSDG